MNKKVAKRIKKFCVVTGKMLDPKKLKSQPFGNKRFYRKLKKLYNMIPKDFRNQYMLVLQGTVDGAKQ